MTCPFDFLAVLSSVSEETYHEPVEKASFNSAQVRSFSAICNDKRKLAPSSDLLIVVVVGRPCSTASADSKRFRNPRSMRSIASVVVTPRAIFSIEWTWNRKM